MSCCTRLPSVLVLTLLATLSAGCGQEGQSASGKGGPSGDEGASGPGTSSGPAGSGGDQGSGASGGAGPGSGTGGGTAAGGASGSYDLDPQISWHQPSLHASLHFSPDEDLEPIVLDELAQATQSIRLAFFNIRVAEVKFILTQKIAAGVDVHVVLDKKQQDLPYNTMGAELVQAGVPVTLVDNTSADFATMHDKFTVIDGHRVVTGSANYSATAFHVSDEDLLVVDDKALSDHYLTEFDELVAGGSATGAPYAGSPKIQAWMGPEDGLDDRVIAALDAAQSDVRLAMFQLNVPSLVQALLDAHGRGVNVIVVLDSVQAAASDSDETLAAGGVPTILVENNGGMAAEMHSKFLVVDHAHVLLGSYNWTNQGSYYNDENLVVIDDAHLAARAEGKFARLLDVYPGPTPASLGLPTGPQDVTFEVTNLKLDPGAVILIGSDGGAFDVPVELVGNKLSTKLPAGSFVSYRYTIESGSKELLAESPGRHTFTVPYASGPFVVKDAISP